MTILETHIVPAVKKEIRLQEYAPSIFKIITTKSGIKKAIRREEILIDGKIAKTSDWITEGQRIDLIQSSLPQKKFFTLQLEVLYEDDFLAVINKPAGYPTSGNFFKTVENALPFNLKNSSEKDALPYPLPVHRLDNPTSGLLIIAKTRTSQVFLNQAFEKQEIRKRYFAIVAGEFPERMQISDKIENKEAVTNIQRLKTFYTNEVVFSLLKVTPLTGRTHQIRRHLSDKGFPIIGDTIYGNTGETESKGLFLAATGVEFKHPISGEVLKIELSVPKKFQNF